ncbi:pentatricopeptide repeat-containing protein At4g02750-like [Selaginella moellendorffii]|uniref:pentatricopeptide repeat-containing protein At4g02750-like n=1 Tax=Selaginella moellendorffii TaxID=88036 RepID=UPI000D1D0157|nr:pentatricopeptide repeat-containing protein At4g02750-like [Selaginella moellendorffii]|eukprot:XP_024533212.1 pentatricopeptide repeat-containing protein At4g02750-like [Selaginella moellendorffii]
MLAALSQNGRFSDARKLFDRLPQWDPFACNAMIVAFGLKGQILESKRLFDSMLHRTTASYNSLISAFSQNGDLASARLVFDRISHRNVITWNAMLTALALSGHLDDAKALFDEIPERSVVTYNTMIVGISQNSNVEQARDFFDKAAQPDVVTWTAMITAYAQKGHLDQARALFEEIPARTVVSWTAMISGYAQHGSMDHAAELFQRMPPELRSTVTWNVMITGYAQIGRVEEARDLFQRMGPSKRDVISWTALIDGYVRRNDLGKARGLFDRMEDKDVVAWGTMLEGYAQRGHLQESLELFRSMDLHGYPINKVIFISILDACVHARALAEGKLLYELAAAKDLAADVTMTSVMVNLYAKCGCLATARDLFDCIERRDLVAWNGMIAAYAQSGHSLLGLAAFWEMLAQGEDPDGVTFNIAISACSHKGLLKVGLQLFLDIEESFAMIRSLDQYICMIDLLGRSGMLEQAEELTESMPFEPDLVSWRTLLCCSGIHGDLGCGQRAASRLLDLEGGGEAASMDWIEDDKATPYVVLSNIFVNQDHPV